MTSPLEVLVALVTPVLVPGGRAHAHAAPNSPR
ncbi:hypothetical protein HNR68_001028 [Saccharopolyspora hordei]|uniref:Uncharacterized protein n=1 Tax=Saccharopolyspora hordei TaxID=1838 RepID=A0A853AEM6_9PSEU|nr:hypothetical protein [Saccharopolyspora hordei]